MTNRLRAVGDAALRKSGHQIPAHLPQLIRDRQFDASLLVATTDMSAGLFGESAMEALRKRNPQDKRLLYGRAKQEFNRADYGAASETLRHITEHHPNFVPAIALLARTLAAGGRWDDLQRCLEQAPPGVTDHADYWLAIGDQGQHTADGPAAIAAYARATRRRPNDTAAWIRLATALKRWMPNQSEITEGSTALGDVPLDRETILPAVESRLAELLELRKHFFAFSAAQNQQDAVAVAQSLLKLGRNWEAEAWSALAVTLSGDSDEDVADLRRRIVATLASDRKWQATRGHPELTFDHGISSGPGVEEPSPGGVKRRQAINPRALRAAAIPVQLRERSANWQLSFLGQVGDRVDGPFVPLSQTTGCGGGAIDFDRDGRIDLLLTAAGGTIGQRDSNKGAMMRNLGGRFADSPSSDGP